MGSLGTQDGGDVVTAYAAFTEQLRALCLTDFPGGMGSWNKTRFKVMKTKYSKVTYWEDERRAVGEENPDALKEFLTSSFSPWALEGDWSPDLEQLREVAVESPQRISETFIFSQFRTLRLVDKEVVEVDNNLLKFHSLEELILSANKIRNIDSANLPRKLKVLELCGNEMISLKDLCFSAPRKIQHLGLGYNRMSCPSESTYLDVHYWPNLVSLDLSFNNLTDLRGIIFKLITLHQLRILLLQGNPLALLPWYRGYVIDSLPKLSVLDDVVISTDGKLQFKGLSQREDLLQYAAQVVVTIGKLQGLPHPMIPSEQEDAAEYPVITYNYYVSYEFVCDRTNTDVDNTKAVTENNDQENQVVSNVEEFSPKPPEGSRESAEAQSVAMNPLLEKLQLNKSATFYNTAGKEWEEVVESSYSHKHFLGDLLELKAFLLHGATVAVVEEKTLYWPAEEVRVESGKSQSPKKGGKAKDNEKQKEKGKQSAKDRKASGKKKKVTLSDLRHDAPIRRTIGSLNLQLEKLISGESLMDTVPNFGEFPAPIVETARSKDGKKSKDKKPKSGRDSGASQKTTASNKGKGKGKASVDVSASEDQPPPPMVPLTVEFQVQLVQWMSVPETLQQELSESKVDISASPEGAVIP
ncbi:leucine-rich repeat-containing protein 43 [Ambystoma mexicanum]|uniref:leucine-rich repeat-containing protein 43 n=1 Tax=Ambystoma mexicanum TaxID=8296 RepID=UPI0037E75987